jgi:quercetin dioxygenase-like cupin family protein
MKVRHVILIAASAAAAGALAQAKIGSKQEVNVPLSELKFETPFGPQGPGFATIWGDRAKGEHGSFLKLAAGAPAQMHTHPGETWGVVITGSMQHVVEGRPGKKLGPGGWWFMPANVPHQSICAPGDECLVFIHNAGPFGYAPVEEKKK